MYKSPSPGSSNSAHHQFAVILVERRYLLHSTALRAEPAGCQSLSLAAHTASAAAVLLRTTTSDWQAPRTTA